jgi:hypothetical protein
VVHEAMGFGAKRVKRLEVIELAIFPVQFPVEFRVYVAFRFMKRPEDAAIGLATLSVWTFAVRILALTMFARVLTVRLEMFEILVTFKFVPKIEDPLRVVILVLDRLEVPVTFKFVPKIEDTFKVAALVVPVTFRFVPKIKDPFIVVTFVVDKLEFPVTFRFVPKIEDPFRVTTLVLNRFDVSVTFKFVPKIEAALRVVILVLDRFDVPVTFKFVPKIEAALRVAIFARVWTVKFVMLVVAEFRVARLEVPVTLRVPPERDVIFIMAALPVV